MRRLALVLAMVVAAYPLRASADSLKVAVGQKGAWSADFLEFAKTNGFFAEVGVDVELIDTAGGAETLRQVTAGDVDVGIGVGFIGVISAYVTGAPVRVISAESTGAGDLYWYARADSGIQTLHDVVGRTIAFGAPGSASHLTLLALLAQENVAATPVATGDPAAALTEVMDGKVDVGWAVPPTGLKEIQEGKLVIVGRGNEVSAMNNMTVRVNVANAASLQGKREAIARLIAADAKAIDWAYRDPHAIDYFSQAHDLPRAIALRSIAEFYPKSTYQLADVKGVQAVLDEALQAQRIPRAMTPNDIGGLFDIVYTRRQQP